MTGSSHRDLLATGSGAEPTLLPADPVAAALHAAESADVMKLVREFPASSLVWAMLAEQALQARSKEADVAAYAYARTGYHRGLDALRRAGWRGSGPIPWEHEPNRGFLRALHALAVAAERIGDTVEQARCAQFLRDSSETAHSVLTAGFTDPATGADNMS